MTKNDLVKEGRALIQLAQDINLFARMTCGRNVVDVKNIRAKVEKYVSTFNTKSMQKLFEKLEDLGNRMMYDADID